MTTFARIAKILKGLVEPRNWVEKAFSGVKVEDEKFHVKITGTVTSSSKYISVRILGDEAVNVFNELNKGDGGDKGIIEFIVDGESLNFPAVLLPREGSRISVASSEPVFRGLGDSRQLIYLSFTGSASSNNGVFYISQYVIDTTVYE